jgi:hypothetical protein
MPVQPVPAEKKGFWGRVVGVFHGDDSGENKNKDQDGNNPNPR